MTDTVNAEQPSDLADSVTDQASAAEAFKRMGLFESTQPDRTPDEQSSDDAPEALEATDANTDEPTGEDVPEQVDEEPVYTVKIDGKEEAVPLKELLAGYQKDKDYRSKTAKLADERRALEQEREVLKQVQAERQHLAAMLQNVIPTLEKQITDKFGKVDWLQLARENPAEWAAMRAEYEVQQQQLAFAQQEKQRVERQQAEEFQKSHQRFLEEQSKALAEKIPEYADAEKGPKFKAALKSYLKDEGLNDLEISGIADHRMVVIARKAMLYDQAQKAKTTAAQAARVVPQVQRPGASPRVDVKAEIQKSAMEKLRKSGRPEDAAFAFKSLRLNG